jgi:tetratricopeptide (TPR) repeat protein
MGIPVKIAMLIVVLLSAPQRAAYVVEGNLALESGLIDESFLVRLDDLAGRTIDQVYASVAGSFRFRDIQAGKYYVRVNHKEFKDAWLLIDVPSGSEGLIIFISREDSFASKHDDVLGSKHKVDVRQLSVPKPAVREYQRALKDKQRGNAASALQRLENATRLAPNFAEAYTQLGKIHLDNNDLEQALRALEHAAQSDAKSVEAAFHRGSTLYKMTRFQEAEAVFLQAQDLDPKQPQIRLMLANVFVKRQKLREALSQLDAYLEENPDGADRSDAERMRAQINDVRGGHQILANQRLRP